MNECYVTPILQRGANYVSDTYRILIRGGYATDTYRRSIRKKKMKHKSDTYLGTHRILCGTYHRERERAEDLLPIDRSREREGYMDCLVVSWAGLS